MFKVWNAPISRPTKDIDLLGKTKSDIDSVISIMREACIQEVEPDGVIFDPESVTATTIIEDADYEGVRVHIQGYLGKGRVTIQIDIGFGDVVVPEATKILYPTILDFPPPELKGYSIESTIAEKLQAMVRLGVLNSRMKDFYDVWLLSRQFSLDGRTLATAIHKTFAKRKTEIPTQLKPLLESLVNDTSKEGQWKTFIRKAKLDNAPASFIEVVSTINAFLGPIIAALAKGKDFKEIWKPPGPWSQA